MYSLQLSYPTLHCKLQTVNCTLYIVNYKFFTMKKFTLLLLSICFLTAVNAQNNPKALFIGIDGVRSDALQQANTPNLSALFNNGIATYDSWNLGVTSSGPAWTSMLTGVWEAKHGVYNNSYTGSNFMAYPYFPNYIKQVDNSIKCVQIITWNPMDDAAKGTGGNVINANWDLSIDAGDLGQGLVTEAAKIQLLDPDLDVLFIHYDETDAAGHGFGFSPNVTQYMNALEDIDQQIGEVLTALQARPNYANEDWIILGTTDHGGSGTSHGGNSNDERAIWWYVSGDLLPDSLITSIDPGSYVMTNNPVVPSVLEQTPVQTDIAVTIIDWMLPGTDPETHPGWSLDGKSWIPETLVSNNNVAKELNTVSAFPNPATDVLFINSTVTYNNATISIYNTVGQMVKTEILDLQAGAQINLSITDLPQGAYILNVTTEKGEVAENERIIVIK